MRFSPTCLHSHLPPGSLRVSLVEEPTSQCWCAVSGNDEAIEVAGMKFRKSQGRMRCSGFSVYARFGGKKADAGNCLC